MSYVRILHTYNLDASPVIIMTMDPKCCSSCLNPIVRILHTHDLILLLLPCPSVAQAVGISPVSANSRDPSSQVLAVCFACRGRTRQAQLKKRVASGELVSNSRAPATRPAPISPAHWDDSQQALQGRGQQSDQNYPGRSTVSTSS
jgi:hypothetical protein